MRVASNPLQPSVPSGGYEAHDPDLLDRLLDVECAYTEFNARRALRPDEGQLEWRALDRRARAVRDAVRPEIAYYNRVLGLSEAALPALDDVLAWHDEIGAPTQLDLTPDAMTAPLLEAIQRRGFRHAGLVSVLAADPEALIQSMCPPQVLSRSPECEVTIEQVTERNVEHFFDHLQSTAPALPPIRSELRALRQAHFTRPPFYVFLAVSKCGHDAGQAVASASLFCHDGVAVLANATTLQGMRGRGYQQALLEHRLCVAAELGCELVVTDALYGTTAQRTLEQAGMRPLWDVAWWVRDEVY